jgi:dolichyl-phosphate-mannose--protein O-mannosyl transferase
VVFDEVYFGNFSNFYIQSQFYYDIHPPLAKIVAFVFANMSEYDGSIDFNHCPDGKYPMPDYVMLRVTPALFSALCGPLIYLSVRFAKFSPASAAAAAVLTIFDTSLGTEGRHILSDGILHFFSVLHVAILFYTLSLRNRSRGFIVWHILTGVSLGAACSCKNTAWGLAALDGFCYVVDLAIYLKIGIFDYIFEIVIWGVSLAFLMVAVYILVFMIHFMLLPFAGPGTGYLIEEMKEQLIGNVGASAGLWGRRLMGHGLVWRTMWLTWNMHSGNMGIQEFHDSMSFPQQWPICTGIMTYFWGREGHEIRCLANVFSYYFALIGVLLVWFGFRKKNWIQGIKFACGWSVCYFPFFLIPRVMYQYHYCIPLMLGAMAFAACLDLYIPTKWRMIVVAVVISLTVFGFWLWAPYTYGTRLHNRKKAVWCNYWVDGDAAHQSRRVEHYKSKERAGHRDDWD